MNKNILTISSIILFLTFIIFKVNISIMITLVSLSFIFLLFLQSGVFSGLLGSTILFSITGLDRYVINQYGISNIDIILFSFILVLIFVKRNKLGFFRESINVLIFMIFLVVFYTILGSINGNMDDVFNFLRFVIKNIIIFCMSIFIYNFKGKTGFFKIVLLINIYTCLMGIYEWNLNFNTVNTSNFFYRSVGLVGNSNILGQLIVITSIPIFSLLVESRKNILLGMFLFIINLYSLFLTQSRGSIFTFIAICFFFLILNYKKINIRYKHIFFFSFIFSITVICYIIINNNPVFLNRILGLGETNDYSNGRMNTLITGIQNIFNSIFGIGIGNTDINNLGLSSHNFYVHVLSEVGILISPLLLTIIGYLFHVLTKCLIFTLKDNKSYLSIYYVIATLMFGVFTHNIFYHGHYYLMLAMVCFELNQIKGKNKILPHQ